MTEDMVWSGDSSSLVFTGYDSSARTTSNLYVINRDGTGLQQLTFDGKATHASWRTISNQAPTTSPDHAIVHSNTPRLIDVLSNDDDETTLSGANLSITTPPAHGTAIIKSGKIFYSPRSGYSGSDQLEYQICDSFMADQKCASSSVKIVVLASSKPLPIFIPPFIDHKPASADDKDHPTDSITVLLALATIDSRSFAASLDHTYTTTNTRPVFSGTASPGASIKLLLSGSRSSSATTLTTISDENGEWSVAPIEALAAGDYSVRITAGLNGTISKPEVFVLGVRTEPANASQKPNSFLAQALGSSFLLGVCVVFVILWRLKKKREEK